MSSRYVKLSDSLFLVEQTVEPSRKVVETQNVNHIWIYDRSGSMSGLLSDLIHDLKIQLRTLTPGDTISIGWFSGEGQFRFLVKGHEISKTQNFSKLDAILDGASTTVGTTCFSEILADAKTVIDELAAYGPIFALCFFTDGYPVVSNYQNEVLDINRAINNIAGSLTSSLFVGYGRYYNKELMADMSSKAGGFLIHADNLATFNIEFNGFLTGTVDISPKQVIELEEDPSYAFVFNMNGRSINVYDIDGANQDLQISPSRNKANFIYYLVNDTPKSAIKFPDGSDMTVNLARAAYAASYILTQRTKTDIALDLLGALGDVALIDAVTNAFTIEEYGKAEAAIKRAVGSPKDRYTGGRKMGYIAKEDAFCVLDLFDILMKDEDAKFFPYHPGFGYSRIGAKAEQKTGYSKFQADNYAGSELANLTWNDTRLNLSMLCQIPGTVELPEGCNKLGFSKTYPCSIFRNYTVVKDGSLNIAQIPLYIATSTQIALESLGMEPVSHEMSPRGEPVLFYDLSSLPLVNRNIARSVTKATVLAELKIEEEYLCAEQKVVKYYIEQLKKTVVTASKTLNAEQEKFLEAAGIKRGVYSPPSTEIPPTDFYMSKEFVIAVKGFSSLPKVPDVQSKLTEGKKLTVSETAIQLGLDTLADFAKLKPEPKLAALENRLREIKGRLNVIRSSIQRAKFAVILGKTWFDEFTTRDKNVIELKDHTITFALKESKVAF